MCWNGHWFWRETISDPDWRGPVKWKWQAVMMRFLTGLVL